MAKSKKTGRSLSEAVSIRERFMDREHSRVERVSWEWPDSMVEVGTCEAILYTSDKWQKDGKEINYKHVAEGPQRLFLREDVAEGFSGPVVKLKSLPDSFAVLAKSLGVQAHLFADDSGEKFQKDFAELRFPGACMLGAGKLLNGDTTCFVYDRSGVLALVVGDKLDVLKDGIVG